MFCNNKTASADTFFFRRDNLLSQNMYVRTWGSLTWKIGNFSPFRLHQPGPFARQLHSEPTVSSALSKAKQKFPILTGILITPL